MKTKLIILFSLPLVLIGNFIDAQSYNTLWYDQPAEYFEQSLVLGNGKMGASVFGGVTSEKIYLNDATLWSGGPVDPNMNPGAWKTIPAIREALKNEDYQLADQLNHKVQGKFSESYAPLGTLIVNFKNTGSPEHYYRELNIENATSKVTYTINGVNYTREYFISYPDKIMVMKFTSNKKGALTFELKFNSLLKHTITTAGMELQAMGFAPVEAKPNYTGNTPDAVINDEAKGTRFSAQAKIKNTDGTVTTTDSTLSLKEGTQAIIFISVATSFNGYNNDPVTKGLNANRLAADQLKNASSQTYELLHKNQMDDYQKYYNRVSLNLGKTDAPDLPTNDRLKRYAEGKEDKNLEVLYFNYGRYLLISSSRTPGVPANLQGIWNPYLRPPWSSNYTTNINVEENYWLAENTNLSEMHMPLLSFIKNVSETGKVTAKTFYGVNGWAVCHNSDIWAMSNPVGNFGSGDPNWANWNMGGAWLSTHLWEHYLFTQDKDFLANQAYDLMKGAAQFCLEWLVPDKDGQLITSPSTSPENKYITSSGYHGATFYGGTADIAMIRACMQQAVDASKILNKDPLFREKLLEAISQLRPYHIGEKGNLQEWYFDWDDEDPQHRHQSHLFGLFPGHQITPSTTPELADACRKTLEIKGDETTGWSKGWRINLWARLGDGAHAYKMYRELLKYVDPDGLKTSYSRGGGTYPNLFDAHPPFQIDGNFGGAAAVAEMLLQSDEQKIMILPALPPVWTNGSVKGLCARGGYDISLEWNNSTLTKVTIVARQTGSTVLVYGDKQKNISLKKGESMVVNW